MWTIFFDIDGTLIRTNGAGMGAMGQLICEQFGVNEVPPVRLHGRTDRSIIGELIEKLDIDSPFELADFFSVYSERLEVSLASVEGTVLPGVMPLLKELAAHPEVNLGILTGNARKAASVKLNHFGLSDFFHFGGYGDHHSDRNDVAAQAVDAAKSFLGVRYDDAKTWVIGDTVNDVRCARSIGSKVLAVETGGETSAVLRNSNPDMQLETLTHYRQWMDELGL